ncbi:hypothetical protein GCM10011376_01050 [Nocardioides flavus (ex Wang et al. 2016)]|uniref:histidine kinase n=1 Tax=Nocardioides flavus (ex Wang et al. 2016) TaxID=2058780 RepID=A0ABQ3HHZ2_9ACTN|nr:HAMP domain-containing sensor histidine kinase [Nocardioides flavus (ex Wang et al. 2016)]GHE14980.1 hypothetical protein GCM10011376_01050 [Nocardioides flavus (ex Wang et al. 2016)]
MVAELVPAQGTDDLWRLTMEHSPVGMALVSPSGHVLTANIALCDMLGHDPDVLATLAVEDLTHPDDRADERRLVSRALAGEIDSYRTTRRFVRSDGVVVMGDLSVTLLRDPCGAPIHFISQVADLTERHAFVERLDAAEAAAEAERRTADEFVATVSHELRTPLAAALAHLELLDDSVGVGAEGHRQVVAARRNLRRLSHLVADLLLATRMSSGAVVDRYRVDVARLLAEAVDTAGLDAEVAGVRLESRHPASLVVVADGLRLRQVVDNLLDNAIAYSRAGGVVTVELSEVGDEGDSGLELVVADGGVGIEADDLDEVFGRFFRGANARRLHVPGTGLGLTVVRTIVEAHGGQVAIDSAPGHGTTVRVSIPR